MDVHIDYNDNLYIDGICVDYTDKEGFQAYYDNVSYGQPRSNIPFIKLLNEYQSGLEDYTNAVLLNLLPALTFNIEVFNNIISSQAYYLVIEEYINYWLVFNHFTKIMHFNTLQDWVDKIGNLSNNWCKAVERRKTINPQVLQLFTNVNMYECDRQLSIATGMKQEDCEGWLLSVPQYITVEITEGKITSKVAIDLYNKIQKVILDTILQYNKSLMTKS